MLYKNHILYSIKIISLIINGLGFYLFRKASITPELLTASCFSTHFCCLVLFPHAHLSGVYFAMKLEISGRRQSSYMHSCQVQSNFLHISAYFPCLFILAIRLSYFISFIKLLPQKFLCFIFSVHIVSTLTLTFIN